MSEQRSLCPGGVALQAWLDAHSLDDDGSTVLPRTEGRDALTLTWFAARLGIARAVLWRWSVGERAPHVDSAAAIERTTGIPASTWATSDELRPPVAEPDED